jgi:hypothetical protein
MDGREHGALDIRCKKADMLAAPHCRLDEAIAADRVEGDHRALLAAPRVDGDGAPAVLLHLALQRFLLKGGPKRAHDTLCHQCNQRMSASDPPRNGASCQPAALIESQGVSGCRGFESTASIAASVDPQESVAARAPLELRRAAGDDPIAAPLFGRRRADAAFAEGLQDAVEEIEEILDAVAGDEAHGDRRQRRAARPVAEKPRSLPAL